MKLRTERPHVRAEVKGGGWYGLPVDAREPLMAAWTAGRAFFSCVDLWGDELTIKLGEVTCVTLRTPEGCEAIDEEDTERKQRALTEGTA